MSDIIPGINLIAADSELGLPVVIGVPFERGVLKDASSLAAVSPCGKVCPLAARPLVQWPDGSVRWALLAMQAQETGIHQIMQARDPDASGQAACDPREHPVTLTQADGAIVLDNGLVRVALAAEGPGPIREITALGHAYLAKPKDLCFVVNEADTTHEQERTLQVLEQSPVRARVRISGAHYTQAGKRLLNYRLDVELWANWPALRLDYHFFNLEPGHVELDIHRMALEWELNLGEETQRHFLQANHGMLFYPREVFNPAPVAICADEVCGPPHVEDPAMLLDDTDYPKHLRPPLIDTGEWLGVGDGRHSIYLRMQDFLPMRPKRLASAGNTIELEFWPAAQGTLALPQGRSRRQVVVTAFSEDLLTVAEAERLTNGLFYEGRATVDPAWLRQTGEFEADRTLTPGTHARFEKFFRRLVNLTMAQDMFDLGDTIDTGYSRTYIPVPNNPTLRKNAPAMPRVYQATGHNPLIEWALPQLYEPVWTNNEYDSIFAVCTEIMRGGRADLWAPARWAARHNIEVDFVHYHDDRQQNRATPQHSYRHNYTGSVLSHFWTQGLLQYYCLTGDPDVLEVACALGDKIIENLTIPEMRESFWGFTRELGWPTLALAHLADITGEPRYARQLEEILDYFMHYERQPGSEKAMVPGLWAMSCLFEGADLYQRRTSRDDLKAWLAEYLDKLCQGTLELHREGAPLNNMIPMVMAIGYERTGDPRFLQAGMLCVEEMMDTSYWPAPPNETKPMAITYRGLVRFLHHAQQAGLLDRLEYFTLQGSGVRE